jgi:hypothetical protein
MNYFLFFLHVFIVVVPVFIFYSLDQANVHHKNNNFLSRPYGFFVFFKTDFFKQISHIKMGYEWTVCTVLWFLLYIHLISSSLYFIQDIGFKVILTVIVFLLLLTLIKASFYNLDYYFLEKILNNFDMNVIRGTATLEDYQKLSFVGKRLAFNILSENKNFKLILEQDNITELNDSLASQLIKKERPKEKVKKI